MCSRHVIRSSYNVLYEFVYAQLKLFQICSDFRVFSRHPPFFFGVSVCISHQMWYLLQVIWVKWLYLRACIFWLCRISPVRSICDAELNRVCECVRAVGVLMPCKSSTCDMSSQLCTCACAVLKYCIQSSDYGQRIRWQNCSKCSTIRVYILYFASTCNLDFQMRPNMRPHALRLLLRSKWTSTMMWVYMYMCVVCVSEWVRFVH